MADEKPWVGLWKKQNDFHEEHHIFCEIWDCDVCLNKYNENVFAQGKLAGKKELADEFDFRFGDGMFSKRELMKWLKSQLSEVKK